MFGYMFAGCKSLIEVNLTNATIHDNAGGFFRDASSLSNVDFSTTTFENLTDINNFFSGCTSIYPVDLSSWNTSNVTDMSGMFLHSNLDDIEPWGISNWDVFK